MSWGYSLENFLRKLSITLSSSCLFNECSLPPSTPPPFLIGNNPKVKKSNMTRECIRYFFPVRRCFVFDRPTSDKNLLLQIEKVPENQLEWNFQVESKKFCSYIFSNAKTKTLRGGIIVTGNREFLLSQECLCGFEYVMK